MKELSDDLLDVQRLEMGKMNPVLTEVLVSDLVNELKSTIHPFISDKKHKIEYKVPEGHSIKCDSSRIMQVLINLVTNAIKYSPDGGEIIISVEKKNDSTLFSVQDHGLGLSVDDLDKLFKPFPDIHEKRVRQGTGLGLNISKGIVELHGGEIWAESEGEGKGSVFRFTIPLSI